jgi:hypothetical protein
MVVLCSTSSRFFSLRRASGASQQAQRDKRPLLHGRLRRPSSLRRAAAHILLRHAITVLR